MQKNGNIKIIKTDLRVETLDIAVEKVDYVIHQTSAWQDMSGESSFIIRCNNTFNLLNYA